MVTFFFSIFPHKMVWRGDEITRASGAERIVFLQYNVHGRVNFPINMVMVKLPPRPRLVWAKFVYFSVDRHTDSAGPYVVVAVVVDVASIDSSGPRIYLQTIWIFPFQLIGGHYNVYMCEYPPFSQLEGIVMYLLLNMSHFSDAHFSKMEGGP